MSNLQVDFSKNIGRIKPMHAVNNGPLKKRADQTNSNFDKYAAAGIPFARTHDASFCAGYGGEHTVDVWAIFPNPDADENDPASYDFILTDEYLERTMRAGTKIFYRLGNKIEHWIKKYGTLPPKDFAKWARICEHIIRHYNEGWADGFEWNIEYWEIWNEPDLDPDDAPNKRCWGGTKAQFFDFYEIAAKHLKGCFPNLKIGGPALAGKMDWAEDFLLEMSRRSVPIDFFSWHIYAHTTDKVLARARLAREIMDKAGYTEAESILNEWNYVLDWSEHFTYSLKQIIGFKGAAFASDVMLKCQNEPVDMIMYYDARPSAWNGLFSMYVHSETFKTYESVCQFSELYKLVGQVECIAEDETLGAVAASDGKRGALMISYYTDDDSEKTAKTVDISLSGLDVKKLSVSYVDKTHSGRAKRVEACDKLTLELKPNSFALISVN